MNTCIDVTQYMTLQPSGQWRVNGHRLGLEHIIRPFLKGHCPSAITTELYPGLAIEKVYALIAFYFANKEAVTAYIAEIEREKEEAYQASLLEEPPPVVKRIRALMEQRRKEKAQQNDNPVLA